jgi:glycosyltransferase involved in cell wall biosynthesis
MSLTAVVATRGRDSLPRSLTSAAERLPITEFLLVPAPDAVLPSVPAGLPVRQVRSEGGIYAAWNTGIAAATSSHLLFLNDDDWIEGNGMEAVGLNPGDVWCLPFRCDGSRTRPSVSLALRSKRLRAPDLFTANRAGNINAYLWPIGLFDRFGRFSTDFRVRGDIDWMQRLVGERLGIRWLAGPTYVQSRGPARLSSWQGNESLLVDEAYGVRDSIRRTHGRASIPSTLASLWTLGLARRAVG